MTDIRGLGYIKVQTTDMERWRKLAFEVLGFAKGSGPDKNALYLRMDERASRIVIVAGDADAVVDIGWEVRDHAALARVRAAVEAAGIAVKSLGLEEADARRVEEVIAFQDPSGASIEIFHGAILDHSPVVTPFGAKFV
ncbi:MAG: 2,3-dihydroxybiphenyl 1,2-dioxygenase, partial [Mycobacteriaceae bacterium]